MTQDEIIEMARHIADMFGTRMCDENGDTHGEELYAMGLDDIVDTIKLVAAKERKLCIQDCIDIQTSADNAVKRSGSSEYHEGRWRGAGQVEAAIKSREARGEA